MRYCTLFSPKQSAPTFTCARRAAGKFRSLKNCRNWAFSEKSSEHLQIATSCYIPLERDASHMIKLDVKSGNAQHEVHKFIIDHETEGLYIRESSLQTLHFWGEPSSCTPPKNYSSWLHTHRIRSDPKQVATSWEAELRRTERRAFTALVMELRKDENSAKATSTTPMANLWWKLMDSEGWKNWGMWKILCFCLKKMGESVKWVFYLCWKGVLNKLALAESGKNSAESWSFCSWLTFTKWPYAQYHMQGCLFAVLLKVLCSKLQSLRDTDGSHIVGWRSELRQAPV